MLLVGSRVRRSNGYQWRRFECNGQCTIIMMMIINGVKDQSRSWVSEIFIVDSHLHQQTVHLHLRTPTCVKTLHHFTLSVWAKCDRTSALQKTKWLRKAGGMRPMVVLSFSRWIFSRLRTWSKLQPCIYITFDGIALVIRIIMLCPHGHPRAPCYQNQNRNKAKIISDAVTQPRFHCRKLPVLCCLLAVVCQRNGQSHPLACPLLPIVVKLVCSPQRSSHLSSSLATSFFPTIG